MARAAHEYAAAAAAEEARLRALARESALWDQAEFDLGLYIEMTTPEYGRPDHLAPFLEALDRSMREPVRALVEVAPRMAKTETLLHGFARRLKYRGRDNVAYCSYTSGLAFRKSRKCREMAARSGVWIGDESVRGGGAGGRRFDPSQAVSYWQTNEGGSFAAGGRRGVFTGDGYGMIGYDDPFKGREEAESPTIQEAAISTWRGTLANRIEPGGSAFVTHQAWNDLDVIAQLKDEYSADGKAWELISLPAVIDAVYDEKTGALIGGTPLWPARWSLRELARRKHDVGDYNWFSNYQPERRPPGTRIFHDPARYAVPQIDGAVVVISCDPGIEDNKLKDSSGVVVGACYRRPSPFHTARKPDFEACVDVLHAVDQWFDWPELLDYLEHLQTEVFPGAPILLEEVSAFKALESVARRLNKRLVFHAITPKGSKLLRAQPCAKAWNKGRVRTPASAPWVADFHREATRFTGKQGGKDNRIDALTQLYDFAEHGLAAIGVAEAGSPTTMGASPF